MGDYKKHVRPKKKLGQHFLTDMQYAERIVDALVIEEPSSVLEIGPGTGVLTKRLLKHPMIDLWLVEIDSESVKYLHEHYSLSEGKLIEGDFLKLDLPPVRHIIGNFPYHISSQIFFKVLQYRDEIDQVVCMIQKEVADRICSAHGNKTYGILSVLLQTFYHIKFLFKVPPGSFFPPPKVVSGVIRFQRNDRKTLPCSEELFFRVVKQGFNNRRKTLRNALKNLNLPPEIASTAVFSKRAEQLSVDDFIQLTQLIQEGTDDTRI